MSLGVESGGLDSAVALLLARYFMYKQVYFHPVRRIYDIHLKDFLAEWLDDGVFPTDVESHLRITDNDVLAGIGEAVLRRADRGHDAAVRIATRSHFRLLYERTASGDERDLESVPALYKAASEEFGAERLREDRYPPKGGLPDFPVLRNDGRIDSSLNVS
jgi:HD superfamily phosphohydrolase